LEHPTKSCYRRAVLLEDLAVIGNCQFSALVHRNGSIVWCCLPRFDAEPVFGALLDEAGGGFFSAAPMIPVEGELRYLENTNVTETRFTTPEGSFRVIDFAPRFIQYDRLFRPTQLVRILEPLDGAPRVRVNCEPKLGWSKKPAGRQHGSNHVQFFGYASEARLTTDVPISYLEGQPFVLTERRHLVFSWGDPVHESLPALCDRFFRETVRYWQRWVKHCNVPVLYQREVIRSALTLKLHCFDDTGAIIAATTTSIPESPGSGRTWDYRYCWLRDAYYVLNAFRLLGHFEERERFLQYLLDVACTAPDLELAPLYRIDGRAELDEVLIENWPGFAGEGPVRMGNAAVNQTQYDVYGELVLALTPIFLDDRFRHDASKVALDLVIRLARRAINVAGKPDAGIWEVRKEARPQTFSSLMSWAAADRMAKVAARIVPELESEFRSAAEKVRAEILGKGWNEELGSLVSSYGGTEVDAALLQAAPLRFFDGEDPRLQRTIDATLKRLEMGNWLMRYAEDDGFGVPSVAFVICTFWLIEALAVSGRIDESREAMDRAVATLTPLGLLAEDYDPREKRMWGNFPQAYSHVGLIHAAFAASPRWSEIL
jgi:GH15 family glucan-1,4-alpha-glucosidase